MHNKIVVWKPQEGFNWIPGCRWYYDVKINFKEIGRDD